MYKAPELDPRIPMIKNKNTNKKRSKVCNCNPSAGETGTRFPWNLLVSKHSLPSKLLDNERFSFSTHITGERERRRKRRREGGTEGGEIFF